MRKIHLEELKNPQSGYGRSVMQERRGVAKDRRSLLTRITDTRLVLSVLFTFNAWCHVGFQIELTIRREQIQYFPIQERISTPKF